MESAIRESLPVLRLGARLPAASLPAGARDMFDSLTNALLAINGKRRGPGDPLVSPPRPPGRPG